MVGKVEENISLAKYTSWRVGGCADRLFQPANIEELATFIAQLPEGEPLTWLGLGSNVLVRDGGVRGTVILLRNSLQDLSILNNGLIRAEAGISCAKVARFAARNNYVNCEFLAGIPGTIGGALAMNAGAFGGETWQFVRSVETMNARGELKTRTPKDFSIAYRHVEGVSEEWFIAGIFDFPKGDGEQALKNIKSLLATRSATQPTGEYSCGSVFKNPKDNYAARLIESQGLKGFTIGGAQISMKHANFIVNFNKASARDIEALIEKVEQEIYKNCNLKLVREVRIIGEY